eukprot:5150638-Amphidinium_carterae.1
MSSQKNPNQTKVDGTSEVLGSKQQHGTSEMCGLSVAPLWQQFLSKVCWSFLLLESLHTKLITKS